MKVLLVDDHAVVRAGLRRLLSAMPDWHIEEAANGRDALAALRAVRPDLVLLDLNLPGLGGLELLQRILAEHPPTRVLVLSMHVEVRYAARAMQSGAQGYMSKNASPVELLKAVQMVAQGGRYIENEIAQELALQTVAAPSAAGPLNEREAEIVRLLGAGRTLAEIADALGVAYKTVANSCSQIKTKLGVARTADLVRLSYELGV